MNRTTPQSASSGGTTLYAGLIARLNQQLGQPIGFLNAILYQQTVAIRDITSGNNAFNGAPGYQAGPGWDACTGHGVVDGTQLLTALNSISGA